MPDDLLTREALIADVLKIMRALRPDGLQRSQEGNIRAMLLAHVSGPLQGNPFAVPPRKGERLLRLTAAMACGEPVGLDASLVLALKIAMIVWHVRAGRLDRLRPAESALVIEVLGLDALGRAGNEEVGGTLDGAPASDGPVEFLFP